MFILVGLLLGFIAAIPPGPINVFVMFAFGATTFASIFVDIKVHL